MEQSFNGRNTVRVPRYRRASAVLWLIVVLAAIAAVLSYRAIDRQVDRRLHSAIVARLQAMFPETIVSVGRVAVPQAGEILVNEIHFRPREGHDRSKLLTVQQCALRGNLDIAHWVQQTIEIREVDLHGVQLDLWETKPGHWSLEALRCSPSSSSSIPRMRIFDGIVRLHGNRELPETALALHDVSCEIRPVSSDDGERVAHSTTDGGQRVGSVSVVLKARGSGVFDSLSAQARLAHDRQSWRITGDVDQLSFSADLLSRLPSAFSKYLGQVAGLECKASARFSVLKATSTEPVNFEISGKLSRGRLQDARLPYPLEGLQGDFYCNSAMLQLRSMRAHSGQATFKLSTDIHGFRADAPIVVDAEATSLQLDDRLYKSLPQSWQRIWNRLRLQGSVNASVHLNSDGTIWKHSVGINCQDVSLEAWLFPYPLSNVSGLVRYSDSKITSENLVGLAGGQTVRGQFALAERAGQWFGNLEFSSEQSITLDEEFLSALTPRGEPTSSCESFVRSLHPAGSVQLNSAVFERFPEEPGIWHKKIDAQVVGCTLNYDRFSYPIYDVRGRIVARDGLWRCEQFEGRNDSCRIQCQGQWSSSQQPSIPLELEFRAFAVPMEEELKRALPGDARHLWEQLQPSGSIDAAQVFVKRLKADSAIDILVNLQEDSRSNFATDQSLRLFPKPFPYWLSDVACNITYRPGIVEIKQAAATNGASRISFEGVCEKSPDNHWISHLRWLPSTRLIADNQLLQAMPDSTRQFLTKLDLRGPVSAMGTSQIIFSAISPDQLASSWDMQLDVEDGKFGANNLADGIRGTIWVAGRKKGDELTASGRVAIDAMTVRGVPVTRLAGPFAVTGNQIFFGSTVAQVIPAAQYVPPPGRDAPHSVSATEMTATALSGQVLMSGHGRMDTGKFYLQSKLENADLNLLLQDLGVNHATPQAICSANLEINGVPWNPQTYSGTGAVQLRDAKLYELPIMMRLMRIASVNPADGVAFHTADVQFRIDGDRIPLQLSLDGDVLCLRGSGWANLRRELDLELYSYVGGRTVLSNVLTPLLPDSRLATFMMIEVDGTLDNPRMERRPFPQLEATLQQIFPDKIAATAEGKREFFPKPNRQKSTDGGTSANTARLRVSE